MPRGVHGRSRRALAQAADVVRVEAVDVFVRVNAFQHLDVIDAGRQRQLDQNAVDFLIGVQLVDQRQQLGFTGGSGQVVGAGRKPTSSQARRLLAT